ncbi:hypothetical protein JTB14_028001 [Gonioctena quinquepunctata]|nr:hypothetical protein JTB14_028001 [Gonioctena quinquepunctata]
MNFRVILTLLTGAALVENATASDISGLINIGLKIILNDIKRMGDTILSKNLPIEIPKELEELMLGSLNLKNVTLHGLGGLQFKSKATNIKIDDENVSKTNVVFNLDFNQIGLLTNYIADIGILDELPIYGDGVINLAVSKVSVGVNVSITTKSLFSLKKIEDLNIQLSFRDAPANITGIWKNDDASYFASELVTILEKLFCMWYNYEKDCIDCVLSNILEFVINLFLAFQKGNILTIKCECLKDHKYNFWKFGELAKSYIFGGIGGAMKYLTSGEMNNILLDVSEKIRKNVEEEGILDKFQSLR